MDNDDAVDRTRIRIAWVITGAWAACFPLSIWVPAFPDRVIAWAQAPMMAVAGWLFAVPLIKSRNGNGGGT